MTMTSLILTALFLGQAPQPGPATTIAASQAKDHVGKRCAVSMTVRLSRDVPASEVYFFNSEKNYRDPDNLALVLEYADAKAFKAAGIEAPAEYYRDKKIQVTGVIIRENSQTRIRLKEPSQIKVVAK